jgi:mannose-6-phosphate isomerase
MVNPIHHYAWGSRTALAWMQGRKPSGDPEAELWMGAHPSAPSGLSWADDEEPLDSLIVRAPEHVLGAEVSRRFRNRLPFLLKILAFDQPLSVQVHPNAEYAEQAWQGQQNGPQSQPHHYCDPYAKPELLYALQPIDAMCGFRNVAEARELFNLIGSDRLTDLVDVLTDDAPEEERLHRAFTTLVHWPVSDRADFVADIGRAARERLATAGGPGNGPPAAHRRALTWCSRLARLYPEDPLVAAPLLLDLLRLEPGDTLFVPAGAPHAYLYGLGVEIMASSDNVLRAGLTHKPIAVEELLRVVDGSTRPVRHLPQIQLGPFEVTWLPPVEDFQLTRLRLPHGAPVAVYPFLVGPQILLCTAGAVTVTIGHRDVVLHPGESAFIGAGGGPVSARGPGELFRASAGQAAPSGATGRT